MIKRLGLKVSRFNGIREPGARRLYSISLPGRSQDRRQKGKAEHTSRPFPPHVVSMVQYSVAVITLSSRIVCARDHRRLERSASEALLGVAIG